MLGLPDPEPGPAPAAAKAEPGTPGLLPGGAADAGPLGPFPDDDLGGGDRGRFLRDRENKTKLREFTLRTHVRAAKASEAS